MATVEFQMSTSAFLKAQKNALLQRLACPPAPFAVTGTDGSTLVTVVIDRIEVGANSLVHNKHTTFDVDGMGSGSSSGDKVRVGIAEGFRVQLVQDFTVHVTTLEDIVSRPDQEPATVVPVACKLFLSLDTEIGFKGQINMTIDLSESESTITVPPSASAIPIPWDVVTNTIRTALRQGLPPVSVPINDGQGAATGFLNAGVSVDTSLSRIAVRGDTALDVGNTKVFLWQDFYNGNFPDRLGGNDWALFFDGNFVGSIVDARIRTGLNDVPPEVEIIPLTTYSNVGGKAVFNIDLNINVEVPGIAGDIMDMFPGLAGSGHMDLRIPVEIRLKTQTELEAEADMSTLQAQATPFLGLVGSLIDLFGFSLQAFIDFAAQSALSGSSSLAGLGDAAAACSVTPQHSILCKSAVTVPSPGGMPFGIVSLIPEPDGFSLAGNLRASALSPAVLEVGRRQIRLSPPKVDCSNAGMAIVAAFSSDPKGWEIIQGQIFIGNLGTAPLTLCDYQVVSNDWATAFPRSGLRPDGMIAPIDISVRFATPDPRYYQGDGAGRPGNYPCIVLLRTSAGTRAFSLGPAPLVTEEDLNRIKAELIVKVGDCTILIDNWWEGNHAHNPDWFIPDPPDQRAGRHWLVDVEGLHPGDAAALVDHNGIELVRGVARAGTPVRLSTFVQPIAGQRDVSLVKIPAIVGGGVGAASVRSMMAAEADKNGGVGGDGRPTRGISTFQQSLIPIGSVRLDGPCVEVVASRGAGAHSFVAVTCESVVSYDLTNPLHPMVVGQWSFEGCRGAVPWKGGVLAFGDDGMALIEGNRMHRIDEGRRDAFPVKSAAETDGQLFAVTDDGVTILDARLRRLRKLEMKNGREPRSIVAAGHCMALGCSDGIMTMPKDGCREAKRLATRQNLRVRRLSRPTMRLTGAGVLAELEDGSARLLDVGNNEAEELMLYAQTPWFAHTARLGSLLAHRVADANRLEFYRLGPHDRR